MNFKISHPQFQTEPTFPQQVDLKSILPFINSIPSLNSLILSPKNNFKQVFLDSKQTILQKKKQLNEFIKETSQALKAAENTFQTNKKYFLNKISTKNEIPPNKISDIRRLEIINHKYYSVLQKYKKALVIFQKKEEHYISDFTLVCEWFISNPQPFYINVDAAFPSMSLLFFLQNQELIKHFNMLEYAIKFQFGYVSLVPEQLFGGSEEMNRNFVKNALQTALNQKKNDQLYFDPLKCEESLFIFFKSKSSPIFSKIKDLDKIRKISSPIVRKRGNEIDDVVNHSELCDFVINWIQESSIIILNFVEKNQKEQVSEDERKIKFDAIGLLLVRFVFNSFFPYLDWHPLPDLLFSRRIEELSKKTARNLHVSLDFLSPELADVVCTKIFEKDSVSRAPVEWIRTAQYEVCPVRAAYCMSKVHEALTIMATIAATDNEIASENTKKNINSNQNQDSRQNLNQVPNDSNNDTNHLEENNESGDANVQAFFSKVPGFDDIFNFWVCLLCSAKLADPRGLNQFIQDWTNLPGVSNRMRASCTYFEAAIAHIESLNQ